MIDNEGFDVGCIWFTDEAHFHLNGFVNKQNWRFWGSENPHLNEEKPLHSPKVTAWVAVCSKGIIGPFFMRETISSERYITILEEFVSTHLALEDRPRIEWFMQDGARPHRTEKVFRFLDEYFGNRNFTDSEEYSTSDAIPESTSTVRPQEPVDEAASDSQSSQESSSEEPISRSPDKGPYRTRYGRVVKPPSCYVAKF
ncbi:hypothetical protein AVEN_12855-1 [Araneus ventricosus]|uniref:Tc1-like transposase DDE domain-containing protein n=1 Tax=Araneus ventricosus TaxID=182803 RepID=A0A4Y2ECU4_ARAVE|nr:hypothetical protein AVEN_12855-1 [Araneus ventricosus]